MSGSLVWREPLEMGCVRQVHAQLSLFCNRAMALDDIAALSRVPLVTAFNNTLRRLLN